MTTIETRFKGILRYAITLFAALWIVLCLTLFTVGVALADENTLLDNRNYESGGMASSNFGYGNLAGEAVPVSGFHANWIINHSLRLGFYSESNSLEDEYDMTIDGIKYGINIETTGLDIGYTCDSDRILHPVCGLMIGGGYLKSKRLEDGHTERSDFFIVQPRIGVELNVTKWMRVETLATWRLANGVESDLFDDRDIGGWSAFIGFSFGWF